MIIRKYLLMFILLVSFFVLSQKIILAQTTGVVIPKYTIEDDLQNAFPVLKKAVHCFADPKYQILKGTPGVGNVSFSLKNLLTRAEAVTFVHRIQTSIINSWKPVSIVKTKDETDSQTFSDVTLTNSFSWAYIPIETAYGYGLIKGIGDGQGGILHEFKANDAWTAGLCLKNNLLTPCRGEEGEGGLIKPESSSDRALFVKGLYESMVSLGWFGSCEGDFVVENQDKSEINIFDFNRLIFEFNKIPDKEGYYLETDLNLDGKVSAEDYNLLKANFGKKFNRRYNQAYCPQNNVQYVYTDANDGLSCIGRQK